MKIKFSEDDDLVLKKIPEFLDIKRFAKFVFHECKKYYPQVSLVAYLYKLAATSANRFAEKYIKVEVGQD